MKVVQVIPDINSEAAGPTYSVFRLCHEMYAEIKSLELALVQADSRDPFVRSFSLGLGPKKLKRSPEMHRWLKMKVQMGEIDILHNHSLWMMPNVYTGWAIKGKPIQYIVSPRGTLSEWAMNSGSRFKNAFWLMIQRPAIKHATCFHATAYSEYEDIRRMGFKQPVTIIPNGIDLPGFPLGKKARMGNIRTLLFLGRLHPVKGLDYLLGAWKELQNFFPDWRLRIVGPEGDGQYLRHLKSISVQFGLKRVSFDPPLYGDSKFEAYRAADLYVLPTHSENFGMTVAEALASGTPALVSQGAPWQGLERKAAGWWPGIGEKPLVEALRIAMALPPEELQAMGQNGRAWMEEEFAWSGVAKCMLDTYRWLLGQGDKPDHVVID